MTIPVTFQTVLSREGNEKRINGKENKFQLIRQGYEIYPLDKKIPVYKCNGQKLCGEGIITKMIWENNSTSIIYELISLKSVN